MHNEKDLLPWILGGLSIASVAVAVMIGTADRALPRVAMAPDQPTTRTLPVVGLMPMAPVPVPPESAPLPQTAQSPPTTPVQSRGQIWACTTNGQKTFSNNPCGGNSSLLDLGPINTMDRAPLYRTARGYPPSQSDAPGPGYSDSDSQDISDNGYPTLIGVPVFVRRDSPRTHRPFNHEHSGGARRY